MPVEETAHDFDGIAYTLKRYKTLVVTTAAVQGGIMQEILGAYEDAMETHLAFGRDFSAAAESFGKLEFRRSKKRVEQVLPDYGACDILLAYGHSGPKGPEASEIVKASRVSGPYVPALLEHVMNDLTSYPDFIPIGTMPFLIQEAVKPDFRRCLKLDTGANHVTITEMCTVFVDEI